MSLNRCYHDHELTWYSELSLALTLFEFLLLVLTLWKSAAAVRAGWGHMPLVVLLVRDGSWAFLAIFCKRTPIPIYHTFLTSHRELQVTFVINMVYHEFAPPGTQSALFKYVFPTFSSWQHSVC